jgi:hypothetical protein
MLTFFEVTLFDLVEQASKIPICWYFCVSDNFPCLESFQKRPESNINKIEDNSEKEFQKIRI